MRAEASPEQRKKYLTQAEHELARVAEITKQTLRFYREPSQPTATKIVSVLDSVLMLFGQRLVSAGIRVKREERALSATVLSSPGELRQVIANLVGNAIDAMRTGGQLRIRHLPVPKSAAKPEAGSPDHRRFRHGNSAGCAAHDL